MNTVNRDLRRRKPLADRSNTFIASPSSLSSSSSSKTVLSHSKRFKPSLHDAKKPRSDSLIPATEPSTTPFDFSEKLTDTRLRSLNPTRTGRISSRSAGNQRHVLEKPKDKGLTFPLPAEPIHVRDHTSPLQPEYLIDLDESGTKNNTKYSEEKTTEKIKDKGKTILRYDPIAVVRDPSSSSQEHFEYIQSLVPCGDEVIKSAAVNTSREPRKKNVDVALPFSCPHPRMLKTEHKHGEKLNVGVGGNVEPKSFSVPHARPKKVNSLVLNDYIKQQKAYFAEIDAFELPISYSDPED